MCNSELAIIGLMHCRVLGNATGDCYEMNEKLIEPPVGRQCSMGLSCFCIFYQHRHGLPLFPTTFTSFFCVWLKV